MQLKFGSSQSVKLKPYIEFETFFTTPKTGMGSTPEELQLYYTSPFGRDNAFTHRNLKDDDFNPYVDTI